LDKNNKNSDEKVTTDVLKDTYVQQYFSIYPLHDRWVRNNLKR